MALSHEDADGELHGGAVEGAVLADEDAAVDGHDVVLGKGLLQLATGEVVGVGLTIGGHQDGAVDDEEGGVGGGQTMAVVGVVDGRRHGEGEQLEGPLWAPSGGRLRVYG